MRIIKNLLVLWAVWIIIYIPNGIYSLNGLGMKKIIFELIWSIVGTSIFYGGSWYLPAAAFGLFVVDWLNRKKQFLIRNLLAIFTFFIGCASSNYAGLHLGKLSAIHWCNTLLMGITQVILAYYIAKYQYQIKTHFHNPIWLVIAVVLTYVERLFILRYHLYWNLDRTDVYITLPISIVLLFGFILGTPWHVKTRTAFFFGNFATLLFFTQFMFLPFNIHNHAIYFISTLICSSILSLLILWLSKFKHLTWLQRLYN